MDVSTSPLRGLRLRGTSSIQMNLNKKLAYLLPTLLIANDVAFFF